MPVAPAATELRGIQPDTPSEPTTAPRNPLPTRGRLLPRICQTAAAAAHPPPRPASPRPAQPRQLQLCDAKRIARGAAPAAARAPEIPLPGQARRA